MTKDKALSFFYDRKYSEIFLSFPVEDYEVDFFAPYSIYKITIYTDVVDALKLDVFEEVVLNLLYERSMTSIELENTLCLDGGLVDSILTRLENHGYIENDKMSISELGKEYCVGKNNYRSSGRIISEVRYIFKLHTDDDKKREIYLPYVLTEDELKALMSISLQENLEALDESDESDESDQSDQSDIIELKFGEIGAPYIVRGKKYGSIKNKSHQINKYEVRKLIQRYNELEKGKFDTKINSCDIDYELYTSVWIHCKAVLTKKTDTLLLSEGYSEVLYPTDRYFPGGKISNLIIEIKKNNQIRKGPSQTEKKKNIEIKNLQYKNLECLYQEILTYTNLSKSPVNNYEEGRYFEGQHDLYIQNIYGAFEWLFYYYLKGKRISKKIKDAYDLSGSTSLNRIDLIKKISIDLGLKWKDDYRELFAKCTSKTISSMITKVDTHLSVGLGLIILSSSQKTDYRFRELCKSHPDLLWLLRKLKNQRDELSHTVESACENESFDIRLFDALRNAMGLLLPDFIFPSNNSAEIERKTRIVAHDYWLDELLLLEVFPTHYVKHIMTDNLKNSWVMLLQNKDKFSIAEFINRIYKNMQATLEIAILKIKGSKSVDKSNLLEALVDEVGNSTIFTTVGSNYIERAFKNQATTLGGAALVFLYALKQKNFEVFRRILELNYFEVIGFIIDKRGHGNRMLLNIRVQEVEEILQKWIEIVQEIGEL